MKIREKKFPMLTLVHKFNARVQLTCFIGEYVPLKRWKSLNYGGTGNYIVIILPFEARLK